jgi:hypothetical protein
LAHRCNIAGKNRGIVALAAQSGVVMRHHAAMGWFPTFSPAHAERLVAAPRSATCIRPGSSERMRSHFSLLRVRGWIAHNGNLVNAMLRAEPSAAAHLSDPERPR